MQCENPFRVREVVHYYFNGDAYPGVVTKVTRCTVSVRRIFVTEQDAADSSLQELYDSVVVPPTYMDRVFHWSPKRKKFRNGDTWTLAKGYRRSLNMEF